MCECKPFKPIKNKNIEWVNLDIDDLMAKITVINLTYSLRVEQMDKNSWWSCFYINGSLQWDNNGEMAKTKVAAKKQVIKAINEHLKNC